MTAPCPSHIPAVSSSEEEKTEKKPVYWLVPDVEGKPCPVQAIPLFGAEQLNMSILPVMPMFNMKVAAALLPMSDKGLVNFLSRNKAIFPARYRPTNREGDGHRIRIRLLSAAEIHHIRKMLFSGPGKDNPYPVL